MPAPPEAEVIRLARLGARLTVDEAVARVRAAGGQVSATYWRDIERGHGGRRGKRVPTRASEGLLAQMARATGATPDDLAGAGREDAAQVLREILRRETRASLAVVPDLSPPPRQFRATEEIIAATEPYRIEVLGRVVDALQRLGPGEKLDGRKVFPEWRDNRTAAGYAQAWDTITGLESDPRRIAELWSLWRSHREPGAGQAGGASSGLTAAPAHLAASSSRYAHLML